MSENWPQKPENVLLRVQQTPNPQALKFICNFNFIDEGKVTFKSKEEAKDIILLEALFEVQFVTQLFLNENTLTVSFDGVIEQETFEDEICLIIKEKMPLHKPNIDFENREQEKPKKDREGLSPELQKIEEILDRTIRPGLQADGGDVEVLSFEENLIEIAYQGACGGCPSAMMGTLDAIQGILRQEMGNENLQVRPVMEDYSMGFGYPY